MTGPTVSCIMPTFDRRRFVPAAIAYFARQDWPNKELIVVDDGADCVRDLVPDDPRIVYLRLDTRATVGHKRNVACQKARGEIVAHWDDDDWYAPDRLRRQATALLSKEADVCGITTLLFCNPEEGRAWEFVYPGGAPWVGGSTMMYRRAAWARTPFADCDVGEDARFVGSYGRQKIAVLGESDIHVGRIHAANVAPKVPVGPSWRPLPLERIQAILGGEWSVFARPAAVAASGKPLVTCIMPTANRRPFVALALDRFRVQDYAPAELVVVDSGDPIEDLCAGDPRIRYLRAPAGASIGSQRNDACAAARGDIVVHWDDDDWYASDRLRRQVEPILAGRADVTGLQARHVWNALDGSFWTLGDALHRSMFVGDVHGGTLAYRRSLLAAGHRYDDVSLAEDAKLLTRFLAHGARLERVPNGDSFVYVRHGKNAWRFDTGTFLGATGWSRSERPAYLAERTLEQYRAAAEASSPPSPAPSRIHALRELARVDCLKAATVLLPGVPLRFDRCVAIVASEAYADHLEGALASLARFGAVADAARIVFLEAQAPRSSAVAARHGATVVRWRPLRRHGPGLKGVLYSMAAAVDARQFLCLDADVLVADRLDTLFEAHARLPPGRVLIAPEAVQGPALDLRQALGSVYAATPQEVDGLFAAFPEATEEIHVVNDGVFVADREALLAVDAALSAAPAVVDWVAARSDVWWRQKAALNLALARTRAIEPLDEAYNAQLHIDPAERREVEGRPRPVWRSRPARVLHFNGSGRNAYPSWRRALLGA
jgi:glycosyltransferase involved in cell wall biosynthesis